MAIPSGLEYQFAHPHATMGPRIICSSKRYECEISVLNRELPKITADRQEQLRQAMLEDAFNTIPVTIQSFGALHSIHYVLLKDPEKRYGKFGALGHGYQFMVSGFAEKGPALISFRYYSNDEAEFAQLLSLIEQSEVLDAAGVLAWRLGDLKTVYEERFPSYKEMNNSAFASSKFAGIDIPRTVKTAFSLPGSADEVQSNLIKARAQFATGFDNVATDKAEAVCKMFPRTLSQAMNGI